MPENQEEQSLEEMLKDLKPIPGQQPKEPKTEIEKYLLKFRGINSGRIDESQYLEEPDDKSMWLNFIVDKFGDIKEKLGDLYLYDKMKHGAGTLFKGTIAAGIGAASLFGIYKLHDKFSLVASKLHTGGFGKIYESELSKGATDDIFTGINSLLYHVIADGLGGIASSTMTSLATAVILLTGYNFTKKMVYDGDLDGDEIISRGGLMTLSGIGGGLIGVLVDGPEGVLYGSYIGTGLGFLTYLRSESDL